MDKIHHPMSPSRWGGLLECNCFLSGDDTEESQEGTSNHDVLAKVLTGETVVNLDDGVAWAAQYIITKAAGSIISIEMQLDYYDPITGALLYTGYPDAFCFMPDGTLHVFDYKSGCETEIRYAAQLAGYVLNICQHYMVTPPRIVTHILYGSSQHEVVNDVTLEWCEGILQRVLAAYRSADKVQVANEWCKYCKIRGECGTLLGMATGIVQARCSMLTPAFYKSISHPSLITDPALMGKALWMAKAVKEWVKSVEFTANAMNDAGLVPTGFVSCVKRGDRTLINVEAVMQLFEISRDELPVKLTFGELVQVVKDKKMCTSKEAEAIVMQVAKDYVKRGADSKSLKKQKGG